jgi:lipopolysaccharide export system permease protein
VAPQDVVLLLGYTALGHLPTMLACRCSWPSWSPRAHVPRQRDGDLVRQRRGLRASCGRCCAPAWPVLLVVALLLLFVWPWGNRNSQELRDRYEQRSDLSRVAPGVFQTSSDGRRVFFVEREGADGVNARNVFILSRSRITANR